MLAKINRLRKTEQIQGVFKKGRFCQNDFFVLRAVAKNSGSLRVAFIVSNKIDKRATARNKIRRRMREIIRAAFLEIKKEFDLVIVSKKSAASLSYQKMKEELLGLLERAKIL